MNWYRLKAWAVLVLALLFCTFNQYFETRALNFSPDTIDLIIGQMRLLVEEEGEQGLSKAIQMFEMFNVEDQKALVTILVKNFYKPEYIGAINILARDVKDPGVRAFIIESLANEAKKQNDFEIPAVLSNEEKVQAFLEKFVTLEDDKQIPPLVKEFFKPEYTTSILGLARKINEPQRAIVMQSIVDAMKERKELEILPIISVQNEAEIFRQKLDSGTNQQEFYKKILKEIKKPVNDVLESVAEQIRKNDYKKGTIDYFKEAKFIRIDPKYYVLLVNKAYRPDLNVESNIIYFVVHYDLDFDAKPAYLVQLYKEMEKAQNLNLKTTIKISYEAYYYLEIAKKLGTEQKNYQFASDEGYKTDLNTLREKLPQGLRLIAWRLPVCIVSGAFESDYLVVKDRFDKDTKRGVVTTTRKPKSQTLAIKWRFDQKYEEWHIRPKQAGNWTMYVEDEFIPCASGKRRALTKMGPWEWDWELHDVDWQNNIYKIYNNRYNEYLFADTEETFHPKIQRHVFTKAIVGDVPATATWKIVTNCFENEISD